MHLSTGSLNTDDYWLSCPAVPASAEPKTDPSQSAPQPEKKSLIKGHLMVCPNCELEREPLNQREFKRLDRNEDYADELNVVYQCVKSTGGCGHIFSPGDQNIIRAFLAGDLVPAKRNGNQGSQH